MKKVFILAIASALFSVALFSCSEGDKEENRPSYTVTFDSDGGTPVSEQKIEYGSTAVKPSYSPSKTGYTFLSWYYKDSNGKETEYPFSIAVLSDLTLKAKYSVNSYTVTFDKNGAMNNSGSMETISCSYGEEYELPQNTFTNTGSLFAGWSTSSSSMAVSYEDGAKIKNLSATNGDTVTLYAIWNDTPYHTIEYNLDGGTNDSSNPRKFLEKQQIYINDAQKTGYSFLGWYKNEDFSGKKITGWNAGEVTENIELWAKWQAIPHKITFINNGTVEATQEIYPNEYPAAITVSVPEGWTFAGYYTQPYAKGTQYINTAGQGIKAFDSGEDLNLYASWTYSISYDYSEISSGTVYVNPNPTSYTGEREITLLPLTLKTGWESDGWSDENDDIITKIEAGTLGTRTIKALGVHLIEYNIRFETNGGNWDTEDGGYTPPAKYTIETETICLPRNIDILKDGCTFAGWFSDEGCSGEAVTTIEKGSSGEKKFWAKWE